MWVLILWWQSVISTHSSQRKQKRDNHHNTLAHRTFLPYFPLFLPLDSPLSPAQLSDKIIPLKSSPLLNTCYVLGPVYHAFISKNHALLFGVSTENLGMNKKWCSCPSLTVAKMPSRGFHSCGAIKKKKKDNDKLKGVQRNNVIKCLENKFCQKGWTKLDMFSLKEKKKT